MTGLVFRPIRPHQPPLISLKRLPASPVNHMNIIRAYRRMNALGDPGGSVRLITA